MVRAPERQLLLPGCSEAASLPRSTLCIRTRHTKTAKQNYALLLNVMAVSRHVASRCLTTLHIISFCLMSPHNVSHYLMSCRLTSRHLTLLHTASCCLTSPHITSCRLTSFSVTLHQSSHITSDRLTSLKRREATSGRFMCPCTISCLSV